MGQAPPGDSARIVGPYHFQPPVQIFPAVVIQAHRNAGTRKAHGNAAAHGACTQHARFVHICQRQVPPETRYLVGSPLGKEDMYQSLPLGMGQTGGKTFPLNRHAGIKGLRIHRGLYALENLCRGKLAPVGFGELRLGITKYRCIASCGGDFFIQIAQLAGRRAFDNQVFCKGQPCCHYVFIHHLVHYAHFQRFGCRNRVTGYDGGYRRLHTCKARQTLGAASPGQQAQFDFRQAERCSFERHPVVTAECHLKPAAKGSAVDCRDYWLAGSFHSFQHLHKVGTFARGSAKLADIRPGNKCPVQTRYDNRLDAIICKGFRNAVVQALAHP